MRDKELQKLYTEATNLFENNQLHKAEILIEKVLQTEASARDFERLMGLVKLKDGRIMESIAIFKKIYANSEFDDRAIADLLNAYVAAKQLDDAVELLNQILDQNPTSEWRYALADFYIEQGKHGLALEEYDKASTLAPSNQKIQTAKDLMSHRRFDESHAILSELLEIDPDHPEVLCAIAAQATMTGDYEIAFDFIRGLASRTQYWPKYFLALADLYMHTGELAKARETLQQAVTIHPRDSKLWGMYGSSLDLMLCFDEALTAFERSLEINPTQIQVALAMANTLRSMGRYDRCVSLYQSTIDQSDYNGSAWWGLADLKTYRFSDDEVSRLIKDSKDSEAPVDHRCQINFALGKALEQRHQYDAAFEAYALANRIRRSSLSYDSRAQDELVEGTISGYSRAFLLATDEESAKERTPIFILGLPRSGSTLLEQMLAAHPKIDTAMELPFVSTYAVTLKKLLAEKGGYPEDASRLGIQNFKILAQRFMSEIAPFRRGADHLIDKMPNNFMHIGLIHKMFPGAAIIDIRRNPLDTCLSLFKQHFFKGQEFSYDLRELADFYLGYLKMMNHWNTALPHRIYTLHYEALVTDTESQLRELLDYCQLEFEPACLEPHLQTRAVRTASSEQVRQPITRSNIGYWRNFETHLDILISSLSESPYTDLELFSIKDN